MPLDTFTYYLLKVGFIPPLRAHWLYKKPCFAAAGAADDKHVFVSCILRVLRAA